MKPKKKTLRNITFLSAPETYPKLDAYFGQEPSPMMKLSTLEMLAPGTALQLAHACCEVVPSGILYLDEQFCLVYANQAARHTFEPVEGFTIGMHVGQLLIGADEEKWQMMETQARLNGSHVFQAPLNPKARLDRATVVLKEVELAGGRFLIVMLHPVTSEEPAPKGPRTANLPHLREVVARNQRRFEALYAHLPVNLHFCDGHHRLVDVNQSWLELLGYRRGDVLGRTWTDFLCPASRKELLGPEGHLGLRHQDLRGQEMTFLTQRGQPVEVLYFTAPVRSQGEDETISILIDITHQKRTERDLQEARQQAESANRAKSAFLAHMSHELRTPLNSVLGYTQILAREALSEQQMRGVQTIHRSGEHLLMLINDILDLSRIEVGQMTLKEESFDFQELLNHVVDITRIKAEQKKLSLSTRLQGKLPRYVRSDSRRLRQILLNLLNNAIKFTHEGGVHLLVETAQQVDVVRFSVRDTGVGIPQDRLTSIFEPFHQAHEHSARLKDQGAGLGLAISQRLVELMSGRIGVESWPGHGSTFWFEIPMPPARGHTRQRLRKRVGYHGPARRLLVVDDRWENRLVIHNMLEPLGFELAEASHGAEALKVAASFEPDAILMDLVMPEMDGFEATRRLRADPDLKDTLVIALSASAFEEDRDQSYVAGCDAFVPKPVKMESLLQVLEDKLDLEWKTASDEVQAPRSLHQEEDLIMPEYASLESLARAASQGQVMQVRRELRRLKANDPKGRYAAFWERLERLVSQFHLDEIGELLQTISG